MPRRQKAYITRMRDVGRKTKWVWVNWGNPNQKGYIRRHSLDYWADTTKFRFWKK